MSFEILIEDGNVVGYIGEMLESLKIGKENIVIVAEQVRQASLEESQELKKLTEGCRSFKPDFIYIGKATDLL